MDSIISRPEMIWFLIGLVLFLLELVLPGFVIFFFGVGAWMTAILCLVADPGINVQVLVFAITSIIALVALRRMIQKKFFYNNNDLSDRVEDEFTGREAIATTDLEPKKTGKVEFKGTSWQAESDTPVRQGQTVIIKKKEDFRLFVEPKSN